MVIVEKQKGKTFRSLQDAVKFMRNRRGWIHAVFDYHRNDIVYTEHTTCKGKVVGLKPRPRPDARKIPQGYHCIYLLEG